MIAFVSDLKRSKAPITVTHYKTATALFGDFIADEHDSSLTVDALSRTLLAEFYDWLEATADRSLDTKHRYVEQIRRGWVWLHETEWHTAVPMPRSLAMARDIQGAVKAPTFEESAACVRKCVSEGPRRLATILYATGLRTSQAETLPWTAFDAARGTLTVAPHKGLPGRVVPLAPWFVEELKAWSKTPRGEGRAAELVTGWDVVDQVARTRLLQAWARAEVRREVWEGAPGKAFRRGLTSGLKQLGADKETAELYVGRAVEGARARYLDMGTVPFEHVAHLIPPIESGTILSIRKKGGAA